MSWHSNRLYMEIMINNLNYELKKLRKHCRCHYSSQFYEYTDHHSIVIIDGKELIESYNLSGNYMNLFNITTKQGKNLTLYMYIERCYDKIKYDYKVWATINESQKLILLYPLEIEPSKPYSTLGKKVIDAAEAHLIEYLQYQFDKIEYSSCERNDYCRCAYISSDED